MAVSLEDNHKLFAAAVSNIHKDLTKFTTKRVKVSGQRSRKYLDECVKLCEIMNEQIRAELKTLPTKHRIQKDEQECLGGHSVPKSK